MVGYLHIFAQYYNPGIRIQSFDILWCTKSIANYKPAIDRVKLPHGGCWWFATLYTSCRKITEDKHLNWNDELAFILHTQSWSVLGTETKVPQQHLGYFEDLELFEMKFCSLCDVFEGIWLSSGILFGYHIFHRQQKPEISYVLMVTKLPQGNVVVLITSETLKRMWCAAEISSAYHAGTNIVTGWGKFDKKL